MTISSENYRNDYVGNGSVSAYTYTFKIVNEADLRVTTRDTNGTETTLALAADYTVTGVGSANGGTVVLTAGNLTTGYAITIRRDRALLQQTDIGNQGAFYAKIHEDAFDSLLMQIQTIKSLMDKAILTAETQTGVSLTLALAAADNLIGWNSAATALENKTVGSLGSIVAATNGLEIVSNLIGIKNVGILAAYLATDAVETIKIKDLNVTSGKLAADAVTTAKILDGAVTSAKLSPGAVLPTTGRGSYSNLVVKRASVSTVDIDADSVTLASGAATFDALSVNLTADITASGANGLDTGSEANSKWYAVWVIYNGTTVASLLSLSATAPTMPSGYTYKRRVGWVYNGSGGDLDDFIQRGRIHTLIGNSSVLSGGTSASFAVLSPAVPTTAVGGGFLFVEGGATANITIQTSLDGTAIHVPSYVLGVGRAQIVTHGLNASQQFYYKRAAGTGTLTINFLWYEDNL